MSSFAKLFIFSALLVWLPMSLKLGILNGAIAAIITSISWTIVMAIIFIPIDYFSNRNLPPEALSVSQKRDIQVSGNIEQVFQKALDILKGFKSVRTTTPFKEKLTISARTKITCLTFGEEITLQFDVLSQNSVKIHIKSHPAVRYTLLDYGRNFKNIEYLSNRIRGEEKNN